MKTVIEMAREAGMEWDLIDEDEGQVWYITQAGLKRFAALIRADEREVCAKVCEGMKTYIDRHNAVIQSSAADCAAAIRARGNT